VIGAGRQRLGQHGIQVVGQPRDAQLPREFMKGVLGKAVALPQGRKGGVPLLLLGAGDGTGCLLGRVGSHAAQAFLPLGEHRVVELSPGFQMSPDESQGFRARFAVTPD
jgi:hypothetical protein